MTDTPSPDAAKPGADAAAELSQFQPPPPEETCLPTSDSLNPNLYKPKKTIEDSLNPDLYIRESQESLPDPCNDESPPAVPERGS